MILAPTFSKLNHIIWDAHACPTLGANGDLLTLFEFKKYGFSYVSLNVGFEPNSKIEVLNTITYITDFINHYPQDFKLIQTVTEVLEAKKTNKLAISFDIEGVGPFENNIENIELFYNLGVKQIALIYNKNNDFGGGCFDKDTGLKIQGYEFIKEMNRLGILIDCSHAGYNTSLDILNASTSPIIFSHSNPHKLCGHERNIRDDLIISCAKSNGVIGLNGISIFLAQNEITTSNFVDHIDYIIDLVGVNHVGFGLDFVFEHEKTLELVKCYPDKFPNSKQYYDIKMISPNRIDEIINELIKRAYTNNDIVQIIGGNFFRVASSVWLSK